VDIAKKISRAIRNSSGGLRHVKALGLLVEGRAQVSMNLTNFRETPIARVVETIRREAQRMALASITVSLGLISREHQDVAVWHQLDALTMNRSRPAGGLSASLHSRNSFFIEELRPDGDPAAAPQLRRGAMGAGLIAMVGA
jgi:hypothetical protein